MSRRSTNKMATVQISKLEAILVHALTIKHNLSLQSDTDDRAELMVLIRKEFHDQLEKGDCSTPFSCLLLLLARFTKTLATAKKLIPLFKQLVPYLFKATTYAASEVNFGKIRKRFRDSEPDVKEYIHTTLRTTVDQKRIQGIKADEQLDKRLANPFRITLNVLLENIARDVESNSFPIVMSALETASGSRSIELINSDIAEFSASSIDGFVIQDGQAKSRGGETEPIEKPIIGMTVKRFLERLAYARSFTNADFKAGMDNVALAGKYQPGIVEYIRHIYTRD